MVSRTVRILKFKKLYFSKDATGLKTSTKICCSVHFNLVYPLEDLAIWILEFDDVMVKTPLQIDDDMSRLLEMTNHSQGPLIENGRRAPPTCPTPVGCVRIARRARKTLTLLFTDFFTYFEKKPDCPAV